MRQRQLRGPRRQGCTPGSRRGAGASKPARRCWRRRQRAWNREQIGARAAVLVRWRPGLFDSAAHLVRSRSPASRARGFSPTLSDAPYNFTLSGWVFCSPSWWWKVARGANTSLPNEPSTLAVTEARAQEAHDSVTTPSLLRTYASRTAEIEPVLPRRDRARGVRRYGNDRPRGGAEGGRLEARRPPPSSPAAWPRPPPRSRLLKGGDHVVLTSDCYRRTRQSSPGSLPLGVESTLVNRRRGCAASRPGPGRTKVILAESLQPYLAASPTCRCSHRAGNACPGANLIIDGTFATR